MVEAMVLAAQKLDRYESVNIGWAVATA